MKLIRLIAFLAGFLPVAALIIFLNNRSYYIASARYQESTANATLWISHSGFYWGFPFASFYEGTCYPCGTFDQLIVFKLNVLIWAITASFFGYVIKRIVERRFIPMEYK